MKNFTYDIKVIKRSIKKNGSLPSYYPFIEIKEVPMLSEQII